MTRTNELKHSMRWMIRRDMDSVNEIEHVSFPWQDRWNEALFLAALRQANCIGVVITCGAEFDAIVGFCVYELHQKRIELLRFAVHKDYQRMGYGRAALQRIIDKLDSQRRDVVGVDVPEHNVGTQLFLSQCGFKAAPAGELVRMEYWI